MTKKDVINQLYSLSDTYNGISGVPKNWLRRHIYDMTREDLSNHSKLYMTITLPDGEWLFKIEEYAPGEWDYYIPETREQESHLWDELLNKKDGEVNAFIG